ncbi:Uma2 family endonuclease [Kitasatospora sp. NPDC048286]|uniref:Uma2 family endonuclease n=1 Tax=Kitasatospora sp. NPDC048286 TaxID=3364047 RepID=UPI0037193960
MSELPDWMYAPRDEGWYADDLDHLPQAPRHTELIDGALVFMMSPQRWWHGETIDELKTALRTQLPKGVRVGREMSIKLDKRNRPEPDLLVVRADFEGNRTQFTPDEVLLVVEVVSPESAHRDRTVKVRKYAEAGIPHYWIVEEEGDGRSAVHVYELDQVTASYAPAGIFRGRLERPVPFPIAIDLGRAGD